MDFNFLTFLERNALRKVDFQVDLVQKDLESAVPVSPFHAFLNI